MPGTALSGRNINGDSDTALKDSGQRGRQARKEGLKHSELLYQTNICRAPLLV